MSKTMTMTMAAPTTFAMGSTGSSSSAMAVATQSTCCPNCGFNIPPMTETQIALLDSQARIADLEAQVRLLNQKAAAAVDRWADYEDELSRLRAAAAAPASRQASPPPPPPPKPNSASPPSPTRSSFLPTGAANRISALLAPRKSTPNLRSNNTNNAVPQMPATPGFGSFGGGQAPLSPTPSTATTEDLLEALNREQGLRLAAESRLSTTSREVEELSAALFEQANEMVATERRARAKLEERVEVLEKRDVDKRRRLDRLETAMGRIERVRALLAEDKPGSRSSVESLR